MTSVDRAVMLRDRPVTGSPLQPVGVDRSRLKSRCAMAIGFLIPFNIYLLPVGEERLRVLDLLGAFAWFLIPTLLVLQRRLHLGVVARGSLLLILILPWFFSDWSLGGVAGSIQALRWVLAIGLVYLLHLLLSDDDSVDAFLFGVFWGAVANLPILLLDQLGFGALLQKLGLASSDTSASYFKGEYRSAGMHGHPNGAAAVCSLVVPATIALMRRGRVGSCWLLFAFCVVFAATALTLTRSAAVVSIAVISLSLLLSAPTRILRTLTVTSSVIVVVLLLGPPADSLRWADRAEVEANAAIRVETTQSSWHLVLDNPGGLGSSYSEQLGRSTVLGVTHNAYLQIALLAGIPIALFAIVAFILRIGRLTGRRATEAWFAVQVGLLFLFEEHLSNPTFIVLTVWLMMFPFRHVTGDSWQLREVRPPTYAGTVE